MRAKLLFLGMALGASLVFSSTEENNYGFVGGVSTFNNSIRKASGAIDDSTSYDSGLYVGVFGERNLSPSLVLAPGVYLSQKGAKNSFASRRANYLEASASLRWYFLNESNWRSYFGFGGGFGILLSAEDANVNGVTVDMYKSLSKNELSVQGGWGLEFPVGTDTGMQIGLTYSRSLTNFLDPGQMGGDRGTWSGLYSFLALRFKSQVESNDPESRAREYLRWKNNSTNSSGEKEE